MFQIRTKVTKFVNFHDICRISISDLKYFHLFTYILDDTIDITRKILVRIGNHKSLAQVQDSFKIS